MPKVDISNIKLTRKLDINKVRGVCIKYGLYTRGTNEQYSDMFVKARSARSDENFLKIAQDIWEHSDAEDVGQEHDGFDFETLVWYIFNDCVGTYVNS